VAIVRKAGRKRRTIIEGKRGFALAQFELFFEGLDLSPKLENFFLFFWEIWSFGYYMIDKTSVGASAEAF